MKCKRPKHLLTKKLFVAFLVLTFLICLTLPLLQINLIPTVKANPTLEDFTTYTEKDDSGRISLVGTNHIDTTISCNEDAWLYKDKGTAYFGDFEHKIAVKSTLLSYGRYAVWALTNDVDDIKGLMTAEKTCVYVLSYPTSSTVYRIALHEQYGANDYSDVSVNLAYATWYYLTIKKVGTALTCKIYSDEARTDLLDTLSLTLQANHTFRYIFPVNSYNYGNTGRVNDNIENLEFREAATVTVTINYPQNTTYTTSTIPVQISASGGTIDKIWYNCKNGTSWVYGSNQTYTAPTNMMGFVNGSSYTFFGWANNTDGNMDEETVMFTVAIPPPSNSGTINLYFPATTKLAFQHLDIPYVTSGATITLTVTSGTLNGTSGTFAMYPTSGKLTFTAQENGAITLTSTSNSTNFRINGEAASSASIVDGLNYVIEWSFLEPILLLPIMFILGMFGLGSMFAGPIYGVYKVKHGEYYEGFRTGLIVTVLGVALTIAWLWSGA